MSKFERVSSLGHQMSLVGGWGGGMYNEVDYMSAGGQEGPCTVRSHVWGLGPWTVRSNASWVMVTWDSLILPANRRMDRHD